MNRDIIEGKWTQLKGKARERWGKLTDDDMDMIAGKRDKLVGAIQERYGHAKDKVEDEVREFESRMDKEFSSSSQREHSGATR